MGFERRSLSLPELPNEQIPLPDFSLVDLRVAASQDESLGEVYEHVIERVESYVEARRRWVQWAEGGVQRFRDVNFEDKKHAKELVRHEEHNKLIKSLSGFAIHCKELGLDTDWWDPPYGLRNDGQGQTTRERIDRWAQNIALELADERERNS